MGRRRTIDREKVLDAAEEIVLRDGGTALTFDAVAAAAGITKGGLQYCFGSKDDLISALVERGSKVFDGEIARHTPPGADSRARARGYILASASIDEATQTKFAALLVALIQLPGQIEKIRSWYAQWITKLEPGSHAQRRLRLAIIAAEGAFFLRGLELVDLDQAGWDEVFDDILKMV